MLKQKHLLILLFLFFITNTISAKITIYPPYYEAWVNKNTITKGHYLLKNLSKDNSVKIKVGTSTRMPGFSSQYPVDDWLKLEDTEFVLEPMQSKNVSFLIKVPENAIGELRAMVCFNIKEKEMMTRQRLSVGLYALINKGAEIDGEIEKIKMFPITQNPNGTNSMSFEITIKNKGNIHLRPYGKLIIENENNKKIGEINFKEGWPVFAKRKFNYMGKWTNPDLSSQKLIIRANFRSRHLNKKLQKTFIFEKNPNGKWEKVKNAE